MNVRTLERHGSRYIRVLPILFATLALAYALLTPVAHSQTVVTTATVENDPYGAAYDSLKNEVFVVNYGSDTVSVISDVTNTVNATVSVGSAPYGVAYDNDTGDAFVTNEASGTVTVISAATNTVITTVTVGSGSGLIGVAYDHGAREVFVTNEASGTVWAISDTTYAVTQIPGVESGPIGVAYDASMKEVFVTDEASGYVSVISDTTNTVTATVKVGNYPIGVAYDSGRGEVFVTNDGSNTVSVISATSDTVTATVTVGSGPIGVAYDSGRGEVFVTNDGSNTVSVISDTTNTVTATVKVGNYPIGVAYDSGRGEVFVVNDGSGTVSVMSDSATSTTSSSTTSSSTTSSSTTSGRTVTTTVTTTLPPTSSTTTTISSTTTVTRTIPATSTVTTTTSSTATTTTTIPVTSGTTTLTSTTYTTVPTSCTGNCIATTLTISCHTAFYVGAADSCQATVSSSGSTPTGNIVWSATPSTVGQFSGTACELSNYYYYLYYYSTCTVKFTPTVLPGSFFTLTANYVGDSQNSPSAFTTNALVVTLKTSTTAVSCTPKSAVAGSSTVITCKAVVTGTSPTGTVTWSQSGVGSVMLSPATCTLSAGSCFVSLTGISAGTARLQAVYSGDSDNTPSSRSTTVSLGKAPTAVGVSCTPSSLSIGSGITCTATVSGSYSSQTGTVTWTKLSGKGKVTLSSKTCSLSSGSCSVTVTLTTAGSFTIKATYSGDSNNLRNWGTAVNRASPTIAPALSTSAVALSATGVASVTDSATLSGGYQAGGTVKYEYFSGNSCTGTVNAVGLPVIVSDGVVPRSSSQFFVAVGSYSWDAVYSGDANNNPATSPCQSLVVNSAGASISTVLSASTIVSGSSVMGSATLTGATSNAGGTVTFEFFSGGYCSGLGTTVGLPVAVTNGIVPSSASQNFSTPGSYSWNAVYSGDANNNPATSPCEPLNVRGIPTIVTSLLKVDISKGSSVFDASTLIGATSTAGGSVQYEYFSGSTCTGTATPVGSPVTVTNGVVPNSASQQFGSDGYYSWNAVYSGDANNYGATSGCEPLTVSAIITTALSSSAITIGGYVTDSGSLSGATSNAGGTVTYQYFSGASCSSSPLGILPAVTVTDGVVPISAPTWFFGPAGSYSWNAVYSGDSNNLGSTSQCEPLTVNPALAAPEITVSQASVLSGGSVTLTTTTPFSGGTPAFTCQWLQEVPGGGYTDLGSSFSCTSSSAPYTSTGSLSTSGAWNFELQVTDSSSPPDTATSAAVTVTVS